jgi:hypothetical protein
MRGERKLSNFDDKERILVQTDSDHEMDGLGVNKFLLIG